MARTIYRGKDFKTSTFADLRSEASKRVSRATSLKNLLIILRDLGKEIRLIGRNRKMDMDISAEISFIGEEDYRKFFASNLEIMTSTAEATPGIIVEWDIEELHSDYKDLMIAVLYGGDNLKSVAPDWAWGREELPESMYAAIYHKKDAHVPVWNFEKSAEKFVAHSRKFLVSRS